MLKNVLTTAINVFFLAVAIASWHYFSGLDNASSMLTTPNKLSPSHNWDANLFTPENHSFLGTVKYPEPFPYYFEALVIL